MSKIHLSVALATFNEEKNLARCLQSVVGLADEIVIVDGKSEDQTAAIAHKFGARVISVPNVPNFHINKARALKACRGEWILQLDADEVVSAELNTEIKRTISSSSALAGYWLPRSNNFLGRFLKKGGQYPDYTLRLYERNLGHLPAHDVHEQARVKGRTGHLTHDLLHYGTPDFDSYLIRYNRYTSLISADLAKRHLPLNLYSTFKYLFIKPLAEFVWIYFRHKGFVDGFPGLIFALFSGLRYGVGYIKYWQESNYPA